MQSIAIIFVLAVLTEAIIEYFGTPIPSRFKPYAAAVLGIAVCVLYDADLLALLGYPASVPYAGAVLTGLVISRGSNYLADFMSRLNVISIPATTVQRIEDIAATQPPVAPPGSGSRDAGVSGKETS